MAKANEEKVEVVKRPTKQKVDSLFFKKHQSVLKGIQSGWIQARELPEEQRKKIQPYYSKAAEQFIQGQKAMAEALGIDLFPA